MPTAKRPGWGLLIPHDIRVRSTGPQFLVCPPDHEACLWADLEEVAKHKGRIIYQEMP